MPWYQYLMLDIAVLLMVTAIVIFYTLYEVTIIIYYKSIETTTKKDRINDLRPGHAMA